MRPNTAFTLDADQGQTLSVVGDTYRLVLTGDQTGGAVATIDMLIPPGGGPGPHAHKDIEESFFVIDGEIVVRTETQKYTAGKGALVSIPKGGAIHSFKNESDKVAHILCTVTPSGLEKMFEEMGRPVEEGQFLPPPEMTPDAQQKMEALAKKYGQELFPPDYLDKPK